MRKWLAYGALAVVVGFAGLMLIGALSPNVPRGSYYWMSNPERREVCRKLGAFEASALQQCMQAIEEKAQADVQRAAQR